MKRTHLHIFVVSMLGLFATTSVSLAYYNPGTGRWLSRDPIGEKGGINEYTAMDNSPIGQVDALGLWSNGAWGADQHTPLTRDAFNTAFPARFIPTALRSCADSVLRWLTHANLRQDEGAAQGDNRRHFNRAKDNPVGNGAAAARRAYTDYLAEEEREFRDRLTQAQPDCRASVQALGRLSHSWQDYYAHALVLLARGFTKTLWTATPAVTGSPENVSGATGTINPSSWGVGFGEHGPGEIDGAEGTARQRAATAYVAGRFQVMLKEWFTKCRCCCDQLGTPR
jgi:uncharacterized protein RhaS with RHS repeats